MPDPPDVVTLRCPAKLNLNLACGRAEGDRHPLRSWMIALTFGDDLTVTRRSEGDAGTTQITFADDAPRSDRVDWPPERDLAVRAHRAAEAAAGRSLPVDIRLTKRIPTGGGLGGGSSNAAGTLFALRKLFPVDLSEDTAYALAADLGSDVTFALSALSGNPESSGDASSAIVTQPDDRIVSAPAHLSETGFTLLVPSFGCPTGEVFAAFAAQRPGPLDVSESDLLALAAAGPPTPAACFNYLTLAAAAVRPRLTGIARAAERLLNRPVHLTGSGSTLFVLARHLDEAHELADTLNKADYPDLADTTAFATRAAGGHTSSG